MTVDQARKVLGVPAQAAPAELATAWRRAVKVAHPDVGGSAERFGEVTAAYELLSADALTAASAEPLTGGRPTLSVVWWLAGTGTATAAAVLVILLLTASATIAAGPVAVYTLGWAGHAWWHSTSRPTPRVRRVIRRRLVPAQRAKKV